MVSEAETKARVLGATIALAPNWAENLDLKRVVGIRDTDKFEKQDGYQSIVYIRDDKDADRIYPYMATESVSEALSFLKDKGKDMRSVGQVLNFAGEPSGALHIDPKEIEKIEKEPVNGKDVSFVKLGGWMPYNGTGGVVTDQPFVKTAAELGTEYPNLFLGKSEGQASEPQVSPQNTPASSPNKTKTIE